MAYKDKEKARAYHRARYAKHREKILAVIHTHRAKRPPSHLKHRHGITLSDYEAMLVKQGGVCALCGAPPKTRRLAVDHDHRTNKRRDLLCSRCNRFRVSNHTLETARRVVAYLERHAA